MDATTSIRKIRQASSAMPMMIQICRSTMRSEVMKRTPPIRSPFEDSRGVVTLITRSSDSGSRPV